MVYAYAFVAFGIVWLGLAVVGFGIFKYLRAKSAAERAGQDWPEGL